MRKFGGFSVTIWAIALGCARPCQAADRESFFGRNSARDVLSESVLDSDIEGIEFFHKTKKEEEPLPPDPEIKVAIANGNSAEVKSDASQARVIRAQLDGKAPEEKKQILLAMFGDPRGDEPILAKDDSPQPFKAMMAAKAAGLDDLAFEYAKQHVRFIRDTQDRTMYMTGLLGQAQVAEGMIPAASWVNAPQFEEQRRLREKELKKAQEEGAEEFNPEEIESKLLDERARELLENAKEAEDYAPEKSAEPVKPPLDEKSERARLKGLLAGRVPAAADGKIDVYLFARVNDQHAFETLQAFNQLYKNYSADSRIHFVAFTPEAIAAPDIDNFRAWQQLAFPYRVGSDTAKALDVRQSPTLIFAARTSGEFIKEEGPRAFYVMEEILKAMKGN